MNHLKDFASFIKENKLENFIADCLQTLTLYNIPSLKDISQNEPEFKQCITIRLVQFLESLESGTASEKAKESVSGWQNDALPEVSNNKISLHDILLVYSVQKISLVSFIPHYTDNVQEAVAIMRELESYYKEIQEMAVQVFQKIQDKEERKLLESEERYRDLFDNANDLIHILDPDGRILYVNKAWMETLGFAPEELKDKNIYSFVADREKDHFRSYRQKLIVGESTNESITTCFISKDGKEITVEGFVSCKFKNGKAQYTRGILRDITKRKTDEKKLKFFTDRLIEGEENFKQLIHYAPDAIIVIDEESKILLWNPKAEEIFGWRMEQITGKALTDTIIPPEYREAHARGMHRLLTTGEERVLNKTIEITALHKNGTTFFISLTISRARQVDRSTFISFIRDITQQKKNEFELENKRLELEKSNEELAQYAWLASHDLKEPLRKILTYGDILLLKYSGELNEHIQHHLKRINESAGRMNKLIEAILLYSSVSEDQSAFIVVDLNIIINEVIQDLEVVIKTKKAEIKIGLLPTIEADPVRMRQLFQNLLSNSLKYSKGDVIPTIKISARDVDNNKVEITIQDNGIGFEIKYAEKIFQVFQRLQGGSGYEGTGIGLALCKKIVTTHGGDITAQSKIGGGSSFIVTLPIHQVPV